MTVVFGIIFVALCVAVAVLANRDTQRRKKRLLPGQLWFVEGIGDVVIYAVDEGSDTVFLIPPHRGSDTITWSAAATYKLSLSTVISQGRPSTHLASDLTTNAICPDLLLKKPVQAPDVPASSVPTKEDPKPESSQNQLVPKQKDQGQDTDNREEQ